jgi:hypothetical protein
MNQADIINYGFLNACQYSTNEFAYIEPGSKIARGRFGLKPIFWNMETKVASIHKSAETHVPFPPGHLWDVSHGKFVQWDPMVFDNYSHWEDFRIDELIKSIEDSVDDLGKCENVMLSNGAGSRVLAGILPNTVTVYTVGDRVPKFITEKFQNWKLITQEMKNPFKQLHWHYGRTKKFICGVGFRQLFLSNGEMNLSQVSESGLDIESPFLDTGVVYQILGKIEPYSRASAMESIVKYFDDQ